MWDGRTDNEWLLDKKRRRRIPQDMTSIATSHDKTWGSRWKKKKLPHAGLVTFREGPRQERRGGVVSVSPLDCGWKGSHGDNNNTEVERIIVSPRMCWLLLIFPPTAWFLGIRIYKLLRGTPPQMGLIGHATRHAWDKRRNGKKEKTLLWLSPLSRDGYVDSHKFNISLRYVVHSYNNFLLKKTMLNQF